tara:strand:+ start:176 stop:1045 length:870 start_codon:yes stop_codon:yes gene_type:complete
MLACKPYNTIKECPECNVVKSIKEFYMHKTKLKTKNVFSILPRKYCKDCHIKIKQKYRNKRKLNGCEYDSLYMARKRKQDPLYDLNYEARKKNISLKLLIIYKKQKAQILQQKKMFNNLKIRLNKFKPKKGRDINYYRFFYKVTNKDWANYTKDNPLTNTLIYRIKYNYDTEFNLKEKIRNQLKKKMKKYPNLDYAIRNAVNNNTNTKYCELFDYTIKQLQDHLEEQFTLGMNWVVFRAGEIHIDHIKPQSLFNLHDDNQIKKCWSLDNLQPLWAADNLAKSNFYVEDL